MLMIINYDSDKAEMILKDFFNSTGIYMELLDAEFNRLSNKAQWANISYCGAVQSTEKGFSLCRNSDECLLERCKKSKKIEAHVCHAGLYDVSLPIIFGEKVIGYILFGQIRSDIPFSAIEKHLDTLGVDSLKLKKLFSEIPYMDMDKIESVSRIAEIIAKHILLEKTLTLKSDERLSEIIKYVDENFQENITIHSLSSHTNISKSILYNLFHDNFGTTVKDYINSVRVEKAISFLLETDYSIEEISQRTGFSGGSYFCKIFKEKTGVSPLKFRKRA